MSDGKGFADHIADIQDRDQRNRRIRNLVFAAGRHAFTNFETRTHLFFEAEKFGVHFLPVNYNSPLPDTREVDIVGSEVAGARPILKLDLNAQLGVVAKLSPYSGELAGIPDKAKEDPFHWRIPAFGPLDAATYYCMVRHFKPRQIVEIGAGYSSLIAADAAGRNGGSQITCIDPNPRDFLKASVSVKLLPEKVQSVELGLDGYPVDSGSPNILWFGDFLGFCNRVNNHLVSRGIHGYRLLDEPIEEFASAFGVAAVETEGELVQV